MRKRPTPYVSRSNTLDDIDWNDPGIIEDIRRVFAVLAEIAPKKAQQSADTQQQQTDGEQSEEGSEPITEA